jgi:4-diphosphocytidyl-2-C-methyl-D-erythritol kinase
MIVRRRGKQIVVHAPAKLNLFLEILGKRPDGFHEIETVMTPVSLCDTLTLVDEPAGRLQLACETVGTAQLAATARHAGLVPPTPLPGGADNLVVRALEALRRAAGIELGASVRLTKRIPLAAGMAGGSTDAAAALAGANVLWNLKWPDERLAGVAATLGSDIPFFFARRPAVCRGRGEQVEPIAAGMPLDFVVVAPPVGLSTADVYRACRPATEPESAATLIDAWRRGDKVGTARRLHNRLQPAAAGLCDWIERMARALARHACLGHRMSGSGTSYFALCRTARQARQIAASLAGCGLGRTFAVKSLSAT